MPHSDLVESARTINRTMYDIKFDPETYLSKVAAEEKAAADAIPSVAGTFPTVDFEDTTMFTILGTGSASEVVDVDGKKALNVTMKERSYDQSWADLTKFSLVANETAFTVGTNDIYVKVSNPNDFQIQVRFNIIGGGNSRTLYYILEANQTYDLVIGKDQFGEAGKANDNWGAASGHFGNGIDPQTISLFEIYMPEPDNTIMTDVNTASFIIEELRLK